MPRRVTGYTGRARLPPARERPLPSGVPRARAGSPPAGTRSGASIARGSTAAQGQLCCRTIASPRCLSGTRYSPVRVVHAALNCAQERVGLFLRFNFCGWVWAILKIVFENN